MKNKAFRHRLGFAVAGIVHALRAEKSFRLQILAACAVFAGMLYLRPTPLWWAVIAITTLLVLAAELFNTALELLVDHLHPDQHPSIKLVKDCAAGAVLLVSIAAVCVAAALVWDSLR